jgi:hypothetical protein
MASISGGTVASQPHRSPSPTEMPSLAKALAACRNAGAAAASPSRLSPARTAVTKPASTLTSALRPLSRTARPRDPEAARRLGG